MQLGLSQKSIDIIKESAELITANDTRIRPGHYPTVGMALMEVTEDTLGN